MILWPLCQDTWPALPVSTIPPALLAAKGRGCARKGSSIGAVGVGCGYLVCTGMPRSLTQVGRGLSLIYLLLPPSQACTF